MASRGGKGKEDEAALQSRLEVILEGLGDGVTLQDSSGNLMFANSAAAKTCGFSSVEEFLRATPNEIVGRFEMLDEQGRPFRQEDLPGRKVLNGAASASALIRLRELASGREVWSFVRARGVLGPDGRPDLAINIWQDVSEERRREEHERYLAQATATLSSSLELGSMLSTLARLLVPGLADWCSLHLLEGDDLKTVAVAHVDPARVAVARDYAQRYPPDRGRPLGIWNVLRRGQSELYEEVFDEQLAQGAHDAAHLETLRAIGMKSVLLVPIRTRELVSGAISLVSVRPGRNYDARDRALAEELGRRAGTAIENARLYTAEKTAREQLELLARAGEAFSATFDYEEILRRVVQIALPALGDFAFFDVVEGTGVRRVAAAHDDAEIDHAIKQTKWVRSARTDKNLCALSSGEAGCHPQIDDSWLQDVASDAEHLALLRRLSLGSLLTVPLRAGGQVLGALTACFGKSGRHHTREDVSLAEELARRAAIAVVHARLYAEANAAAKRAEDAARRAEDASRIKDEFLATVSHELRTPLNAIVGWSSLLRGRSVDPYVAKATDVIYRNAQAQAKIIDDILDVSRIITGNLRLELEPADLESIIRDAIEVVRPSATAKDIAIQFAPRAEPCLLVADAQRLQQVMWNLLSNAVKFTGASGTITIAVRQDRSKFVVSVADTGRGIEPDFLPYVFDRFQQADSSTTRRVGGLGLGLAIVRHIVELHGGQAEAASGGSGKGATFTITLPVRALVPTTRPIERACSEAAGQAPRPSSVALRGVRVLVVDDEADARDLLATVLVEAGATVETAASAGDGFDRIRRFRPHVLVSDIGMPEEDGYALITRIRALDPQVGGRTPAIALSAYTRGEDRMKALSAGFTAHVAKPVDPGDFLGVVENLAGLSATRGGS
ncbi:MAG: ATP-binding protein [Myxococcota bacterium]|nr:ATP-binding protein [Myxococcota bacterium]